PKSELGKPAFASRSPELNLVDGVEACDERARVSGVALVRSVEEGGQARVSLLVNHFGEVGEKGVIFYGGTCVTGEVRLAISKPDSIDSIEVWIALKSACTFSESEPETMSMRASLLSRPESFQPGTYVLPYAFEPFPNSVVVRQEEKKNVTGRPLARVPLPPSYNVRAPHWMGRIEYEMGLVVKRKGLRPNDYLEIPLVYRPRHRSKPSLPPPQPFPLIPTRDDWPFEREVVGGWSLTPFGGRGRWCGETKVEVEGLVSPLLSASIPIVNQRTEKQLGIPHPTVAHAGSKINLTLLLWGTHPASLAALSSPGAVRIRLIRAHVMGLDALSPSSRAHTSRIVFEAERWSGSVWADGEQEHEHEGEEEGSEGDDSGVGGLDGVVDEGIVVKGDEVEFEDEMFPGAVDAGNIVKLHGSVCVPSVEDVVPSFRYKNMAVEVRFPIIPANFRSLVAQYLVQVIITHKDYNHISPTGPGIIGETPIWIVTGDQSDTAGPNPRERGRQRRLVGRSIVPVSRDARQAGFGIEVMVTSSATAESDTTLSSSSVSSQSQSFNSLTSMYDDEESTMTVTPKRRYPAHLSRGSPPAGARPRSRSPNSSQYETMEDLLAAAGYTVTRVFTPETERVQRLTGDESTQASTSTARNTSGGGGIGTLVAGWISHIIPHSTGQGGGRTIRRHAVQTPVVRVQGVEDDDDTESNPFLDPSSNLGVASGHHRFPHAARSLRTHLSSTRPTGRPASRPTLHHGRPDRAVPALRHTTSAPSLPRITSSSSGANGGRRRALPAAWRDAGRQQQQQQTAAYKAWSGGFAPKTVETQLKPRSSSGWFGAATGSRSGTIRPSGSNLRIQTSPPGTIRASSQPRGPSATTLAVPTLHRARSAPRPTRIHVPVPAPP
ncbi:hypothetical protein FRC07_009166, partial [Ceratobasidium sp. 392]